MKFFASIAMIVLANAAMAQLSPTPKAAVDQLIPWLLNEDQQLRGVPFSEVILDTTGKKVFRFDANEPVDQRVAKAISAACDETMKRLNATGSAIQNVDRINEVSSHFEDNLRELLNATPGLRCEFPLTNEGKVQRSGYPDLRIVDLESKRVFYLDPKLYAAGSRDSSFRTFFSREASESRTATERHGYSPVWRFTRWDLVDLSRFEVKLKAEFQGSNRDMYRPEAIVASGSGD
ncbi:MAG: hypothetical protein DMF00_10300 [Verrucomicrobia bacterium]|nr:MAG: hypothetical protein DMF00_10300 [Verrucomicrobiota bacterium]